MSADPHPRAAAWRRDLFADAGVGVEVLASLGVVMALALLVLLAAAYRHHEATLRDVLGGALLAEAHAPASLAPRVEPGTGWWRIGARGGAAPIGFVGEEPDERAHALARAARARGAALLDLGSLGDPILFATPDAHSNDVLLAQLPLSASRRLRVRPALVYAGLALADALVFGAFGWVLLRRRIVAPLQTLASAAREIGESGEPVAAHVDGPRELRAVGDALFDMSVALAGRTKQLSTAVVELRETNERLRATRAGLERAERLASVGRLAAGVAHEVGNPLGAMLAFAELAARDPGISQASRGQLERLLKEGERVRAILRQLLDLARPVRMRSEAFDLARVVREAVGLVAPQRRYAAISFRIDEPAETPRALGDPNAAQQILCNLLLNAAEAVQGESEPRIEVIVRSAALRRRPGDAAAAALPRVRPDAIECLVLDNGCGIAEEDRERVFDPFFTTRDAGGGTGLGLPNALRMAEEQGGGLELAAAPPGFRTAFAFRLPTATPPLGGEGVRAS